MAINSVGYDGTVTESQWADMIKKVGSAEYGVVQSGHLRVTAVSGADRTVSVAAGQAWGHGVYDDFTSNTTIALSSVSSGSRWDLIAVRRDWSGSDGTTTLVKINGSSSRSIPSGRNEGPGLLDDQPIALVQITAGQTQPTAIVDLRCWSGNGGVYAQDELALAYLDSVGSQVVINGRTWSRGTSGSGGSAVWSSSAGIGGVPLFGVAKTLAGGIPDANSNFLIQAGSSVMKTDGAGYARLTWPKPFPNGLLSVTAVNGDDWAIGSSGMTFAGSGNPVHGSSGYGNAKDWVYLMAGFATGSNDGPVVHLANKIHRINWIAIGW